MATVAADTESLALKNTTRHAMDAVVNKL